MATIPTPTTCPPNEPIIKFDALGQASVINYNLPTDYSHRSINYLNLNVNTDCFKPAFSTTVPENSFWAAVENMSAEQLADLINDDIAGLNNKPVFVGAQYLQHVPIVHSIPKPSASNMSARNLTDQVKKLKRFNVVNEPVSTADDTFIAGVPVKDVIKQMQKGRRPALKKNLAGQVKLQFIAKPVALRPRIVLALHTRTLIFPLDYGLGKVVKTFSLFPGERTTINLRSFKHKEETRETSQTVFDSNSQSAANNFESSLQTESGQFNQNYNQEDFNIGVGFSVEGVAASITGIGGGVSTNYTTSASTMLQTQANQMQSALNSIASQANSVREVSVSTDVTTNTIEETEETTTRVIANENHSRTLNFVFRQLMQEYVSVTYLEDVSIMASNGYPESFRKVSLENIDDLLKDILTDTAAGPCSGVIDKVRNEITFQLCNIFDYKGDRKSFAVCEEDTYTDCCGTREPETRKIIRKNPALAETVEGRTVNGIILKVDKMVMKTDGVICDALLGGGDALDCYNTVLQKANMYKAELENAQYIQQMELVDSIKAEKASVAADKYKKIFGACCDVPQTGATCGCGGGCNCGDKPTPTPTEVAYGGLFLSFGDFPADGGPISLEGKFITTGPSVNGNLMDGYTELPVTLTGTVNAGTGLTTLMGTGSVSGGGTDITLSYAISTTEIPVSGNEVRFSGMATVGITPTGGGSTTVQTLQLTLTGNLPMASGGSVSLLGKYHL